MLRRPLAAVVALCCAVPAARAAETPNLSEQAAARVEAAAPFDAPVPAELGGDGRRTVSRFVTNFGRNVKGVFSGQSLGPLAVGGALTGAAFALDTGARHVLRNRAEDLGQLGQSAGALRTVAPLTIGLFVAGRSTNDARFRVASYDIAQATLVTGLYTELLKRGVARVRPDGSDRRSFPSGHTSNAFAWATVANRHYGAKLGVPAYALAGFIGVSRVERNKHHLSDVAAGAALGLIVGRTVVREDGQPLRRDRRFSVVPMTDASGGGAGAGISIQF
jgi:membrane-associated phospholipid phosphatase